MYDRVWYLNLGVLVHFTIYGEPLSNIGVCCIYVIWWYSFECCILSDMVKVIQNSCRYDRWSNALGASFLIGKTRVGYVPWFPQRLVQDFLVLILALKTCISLKDIDFASLENSQMMGPLKFLPLYVTGSRFQYFKWMKTFN